MKKKLKKIAEFLLNPRLLFSFGIAWIITNGWSYILLGVGTFLSIEWMSAVAGAYLAFLWLPGTPEKLFTLALSIALLRLFFPQDKKTLAVLDSMREKIKTALKNKKREKNGGREG